MLYVIGKERLLQHAVELGELFDQLLLAHAGGRERGHDVEVELERACDAVRFRPLLPNLKPLLGQANALAALATCCAIPAVSSR